MTTVPQAGADLALRAPTTQQQRDIDQIETSRVPTVDSGGFAHHGVALCSMAAPALASIYRGPATVISVGYGSAGAYVTAPTHPQ